MDTLFKVKVLHAAPKDSHESIEGYVIAKSESKVYEWLAGDPGLFGKMITTCWKDMEHEYPEKIKEEWEWNGGEIPEEIPKTFREKIINLKGEINDEDYDFTDAYYGITLYGWEKIRQVNQNECEVLTELGIAQVIK